MDVAPGTPAGDARHRYRTNKVAGFTLTKRGEVCLVCDNSKKLVCPENCEKGWHCEFVYPMNCREFCPRAICKQGEELTEAPQSGASTNVGGIAGGVVGGLAVIAAITYLVWRYCIRARRQAIALPTYDATEKSTQDSESFTERRDNRASTHTVGSMASTVLTRASNIIQIAYIPGVTNRAAVSPTVLVPPVPPLPLAVSQANSPAPSDQHFFVPGDLRDSTYSALSGYSDRTSYARTSYAPRSSVASTIYGKNAVIVAPAQTGMRAKPAMVSVKSGFSNGSVGSATPPVPSVDFEKYNGSGLRPPSPTGSTFSVGSTFLNNASTHTATPARAMVVRVGSVKKVNGKPKSTSEEPMPSPAASSTVRESNSATIIIDSPSPDQGPFSDPPNAPAAQSTTSLSAVIEEATRRASQKDATLPPRDRERSPFGDEHATQD
jgi:protein OPY2